MMPREMRCSLSLEVLSSVSLPASCGQPHVSPLSTAWLQFCAGFLRLLIGYITLAYPEEKNKGRYIAIQWMMVALGSTVGAIVAFALVCPIRSLSLCLVLICCPDKRRDDRHGCPHERLCHICYRNATLCDCCRYFHHRPEENATIGQFCSITLQAW